MGSQTRESKIVGEHLARIVLDWLMRMQVAEREYVEAELDRASFESFPASDPVSPATDMQRRTRLHIDCMLSEDRLTFARARRSDDNNSPAARGELIETLEIDMPEGLRVVIDVRQADALAHPGREPLELPPEHASLVGREGERRSGDERRVSVQDRGVQDRDATGRSTQGDQADRRSGIERRAH